MKRCRHLILLLAAAIFCSTGAGELKLENPEFLEKNGTIPGWTRCNRPADGGTFSSVEYGARPGFRALRLVSPKQAAWFGVEQVKIPISALPKPAEGEQLKFTLEFQQKNRNVSDGGFVTFCFFSRDGKLLAYRDSPRHSGSFDWTDITATGLFKTIPPGAAKFGIRLFLGKTDGSIEFAEPKLFVDVVQGK